MQEHEKNFETYPLISLEVFNAFDNLSFSRWDSFNFLMTESSFCFDFFDSSHLESSEAIFADLSLCPSACDKIKA